MKSIAILFSIIFLGFLADQFFLWLERKGLIYYRHRKSNSGAIGNGLQELHMLLNPNTRYTIEMKHNEARFKRNEADVPGKNKDD